MILVQIPLEIRVAHLVAVLELAEVLSLLLDGIVGQVDELVVQVRKVKLSRARPYVTILVEIALQCLVDASYESEHSKVKLPTVDQKRIVDVFLYDEGFLEADVVDTASRRYELPHILHLVDDIDATATIGVLARLDDPSVQRYGVLLPNFPNLIVFIVLRPKWIRFIAMFII